MSAAAKWFVALLICSAGVTISYFFVDRPFAYFAHDELSAYRATFDLVGRSPKVLGPLVMACTLVFGVRAVMGRPLTEIQTTIVLSALSLALSAIVENWLKLAFGRTWPETWVQNNPSLIRDGAYGFNPFHGGQGYASFPSGHSTATCAVMAVLWFCYPRFRVVYAVVIAAVVIGLIGADYHFLGDIIAGGFLGW